MPSLYLTFLGTAVLVLGAARADKLPSLDGDCACSLVESQIPQRIFYPVSPTYNESLSSYYSAQESDLQPACIFTPTDAAEVSMFIKIINRKAGDSARRATRPRFAIRSGGHTIWAGAANIEGGITVDMRSMNSLVLSPDKKVAMLGVGGIWSEIYEQLVPYNLTVMGGRVAGIGVGGLATGGEFTWVVNKVMITIELTESRYTRGN